VQTQVEVKKDYTFLSGLRAAMRQDPDVIMVGEIRDEDTAKVASQAALTGHIVLSTLHTNTAAGAVPRFVNLGVDAKTLASSLTLVMAQRLCRKLCPECKIESELNEKDSKVFTNILGSMIADGKESKYKPESKYKVFTANKEGCSKCTLGYKGRIGIYEAIIMTRKIEEVSISSGSERDIANAARDQGIPDMREDGITKILDGITDVEELSKVVDLVYL
jgi:type II secretory ATPase GspE/PulE/Tfp pilus assembly ATPase PilB-like protein